MWLKKGQGPRKLGRNEKLSLEVNIIVLQNYVKRRAMSEPQSAGLRMGRIQCKNEGNCCRTCSQHQSKLNAQCYKKGMQWWHLKKTRQGTRRSVWAKHKLHPLTLTLTCESQINLSQGFKQGLNNRHSSRKNKSPNWNVTRFKSGLLQFSEVLSEIFYFSKGCTWSPPQAKEWAW